MTGSGQSYTRAAATGRQARTLLIELTHQLPEGTRSDVIRLWGEVDAALLRFLRLLDEEEHDRPSG